MDDRGKADGVAGTLGDRIQKQNVLKKLGKWSEINRVKFKKHTDQVLHLGQSNQMYKYKMGNDWQDCSITKKAVWVIVDHKPNISRQCHFLVK